MLHATLQLRPCPPGCRRCTVVARDGAGNVESLRSRGLHLQQRRSLLSQRHVSLSPAIGAIRWQRRQHQVPVFLEPFLLHFPASSVTPISLSHGYQVHVGPMNSNSRGSVLAVSPDVADKPAIRFNYLSTREDEEEWVQAIQKAREILRQPAFSEYNGGESSPGPSVSSPDDILEWVRRDAETAYHPSCTCKMATDDMAVVDPSSMRVHGLKVRCVRLCCVKDE